MTGEFRPELLSRRGERVAWALALIVWAGWTLALWRGLRPPGSVSFLAVFLLLAAMSISLGNWMDRNTVLRLDPTGVKFENGLRRVNLGWDQIREVQVLPSPWGKKVRVLGEGMAHFDFRTLSEVQVRGEVKGRMGFQEGERILKQIIAAAHLQKGSASGGQPGAGYYSARK